MSLNFNWYIWNIKFQYLYFNSYMNLNQTNKLYQIVLYKKNILSIKKQD